MPVNLRIPYLPSCLLPASFRFLSRYHLVTISIPLYYHCVTIQYFPCLYTLHFSPNLVCCTVWRGDEAPAICLALEISQDSPMFVHCPECIRVSLYVVYFPPPKKTHPANPMTCRVGVLFWQNFIGP